MGKIEESMSYICLFWYRDAWCGTYESPK